MNPPWSEQPRNQRTSLADVVANRRSFIERMAGMPVFAAEPRLPWKTAIGLNGFASGEQKCGRTRFLRNMLSLCGKTGFDGAELVQAWRVRDYPDPDQNLARVEAMMEHFGMGARPGTWLAGTGMQQFRLHLRCFGRPDLRVGS